MIFVEIETHNIANPPRDSTLLNHGGAKIVELPKPQTHIMAAEKPVAIVCVGMAGMMRSSG